MQLILISDDVFREHEIEEIIALFAEGLTTLHLRKPEASLSEMRTFLDQLPNELHPKIVVHGFEELLKEFDLKHIHGPNGSSRSCHAFHEVERAFAEGVEYVFLSPIFDSISKKGYKAAFDADELTLFLKNITQPVFALGGIHKERIKKCELLGFKGAAILGAVWKSDNPVKAFKQFING